MPLPVSRSPYPYLLAVTREPLSVSCWPFLSPSGFSGQRAPGNGQRLTGNGIRASANRYGQPATAKRATAGGLQPTGTGSGKREQVIAVALSLPSKCLSTETTRL